MGFRNLGGFLPPIVKGLPFRVWRAGRSARGLGRNGFGFAGRKRTFEVVIMDLKLSLRVRVKTRNPHKKGLRLTSIIRG